jgi:hypothetical protein
VHITAQEAKDLTERTVHQCGCPNCQQPGDHPDKELHYQMNLFLSRLDEQQRRWYVALEAKKLGHGGAQLMSQITGMSVDTIRRGRDELDSSLADRPTDRVRLFGGGRHPVEKNSRASKRH